MEQADFALMLLSQSLLVSSSFFLNCEGRDLLLLRATEQNKRWLPV